MNSSSFKSEVEKLGINVTEEMMNQLSIYLEFLTEYNSHTNLTAIKEPEDIYLKHFYDSLTIFRVVNLYEEKSLLDIGSGAGFPGMVLKIFFPNLHIVLVDSNNKKTKFLTELSEKLGVDNLEVINDRIEKITSKYLNYFDVVTARAVTNMPVLTELAMPLVKKDKFFIAMKGSNMDEINEGKYAITKMNGEVEKLDNFDLLNDGGNRTIIKVKKLQETKQNDLRSYEKIIKKPLIKK